MAYNTSEAYDFSRFEPKNTVVYYGSESTAPELLPEPYFDDTEIIKVGGNPKKKLTQKQLRAMAIARRRRIWKSVFVAVTVMSMFAAVLVCRVASDKVTAETVELELRLSKAESENTRLRMFIDESSSYDKIEEAARNRLGMVKCEQYQITRFNVSGEDKVIAKKED